MWNQLTYPFDLNLIYNVPASSDMVGGSVHAVVDARL